LQYIPKGVSKYNGVYGNLDLVFWTLCFLITDIPDFNVIFFSSSYDMCGHIPAFFKRKWYWYSIAARKLNILGTGGDFVLITATKHDPYSLMKIKPDTTSAMSSLKIL